MMTDYLIGLSVGPVQGFIASARRTRDLWFGSHLLSEVAKAAAQAWLARQGTLIFPAPADAAELVPNSDLDVGNKIMAAFVTDDPRGLLETAKAAARAHWRAIAVSVYLGHKEHIRDDTWNAQIDDVLELYGAWVIIPAGDGGYTQARRRLDRLLGARKTTRGFAAAARDFNEKPGFGTFKSSLDAARETVLKKGRPTWFQRKLGLSPGEQLDCPSLIKRLGDSRKPFAAVPRIALEAWLGANPDADLSAFNAACEHLVERGLITRSQEQRFSRHPYDGAYLFGSRIEAEIARLLPEDRAQDERLLRDLCRARDPLHRQYGEPTPYFAVLVADGDRMGELIDAKDSADDHIALTQALTRFAGQAHRTVTDHQGVCVYAGGDDVLALLPVHRAVGCADTLRQDFASTAGTLAPVGKQPPTLSVGLGLGHVLTPFNRLLDLGRRTEQLAKNGPRGTPAEQQRNALALIVGVRSGAEVSVRGRWDDEAGGLGIAERLEQWTRAYLGDQLSDKTPYDLRAAADRLAWSASEPCRDELADLEVRRVLGKKRADTGQSPLSKSLIHDIASAVQRHGFQPLIHELLAARWLAQKARD